MTESFRRECLWCLGLVYWALWSGVLNLAALMLFWLLKPLQAHRAARLCVSRIIQTVWHVPWVSALTAGFHCNILDQWSMWRLPVSIAFRDIMQAHDSYVWCGSFEYLHKENWRKDIEIIDVTAETGLIGLELHKWATPINTHWIVQMKQERRGFTHSSSAFQRFLELNTGDYDALICVNVFGDNHILPSALAEMCRIVVKGKLLVCSHWYN